MSVMEDPNVVEGTVPLPSGEPTQDQPSRSPRADRGATANSEPDTAPPAKIDGPDRGTGRVEKYSPTKDGVRWFLARGLIWILGGTIVAIFILLATTAMTGLSPEEIRNSTSAIFTALVSLTGSALGFYFGTKDRDD